MAGIAEVYQLADGKNPLDDAPSHADQARPTRAADRDRTGIISLEG